MKFFKRQSKLDKLISEQQKTNELLNDIIKAIEYHSDLQRRYNSAYHIK